MKGRILVYSITGCPHCLRAKSKLSELGLAYTEVQVDNYPAEVREELKNRTGKSTVPQIFFNNVHIGGNSELQELINTNKPEFDRLVSVVREQTPSSDAPSLPDPATALDGDRAAGDFVCEPDEYARLVKEMKEANLIRDHRTCFKQHKASFRGQEFVDWLERNKQISKDRALEMGQELISRRFGHATSRHHELEEKFDPEKYYRLLEDDDTRALNAGPLSECVPLAAAELGETMRKLILKIHGAHLTPDGKAVDYKSMAESADFNKYITLTHQLHRVDVINTTREETLAFFINIYNALVVHANVKLGPPSNLWQRWKFFNTVSYIIGGHTYSLQDIENGVLRANRKGVGMLWKPFGKNDPRLKTALTECEPLIHFALNCGAKSCPPIKSYSAKGVNTELKVAAEAFLESDDAINVDVSTGTVYLSQIFKWYREDFGGTTESTLKWISDHIGNGDKKDTLMSLIANCKPNVSYLHYDWGNNSNDE